MKTNKKYWITICVCLVLSAVMGIWKGLYTAENFHSFIMSLCDCTFISGFLMICVGGLIFCSNEGAFRMIGFACKTTINAFKIWKPLDNRESYADYTERKSKNKTPFLFLIFTGAGFVLIAGICLLIGYLI